MTVKIIRGIYLRLSEIIEPMQKVNKEMNWLFHSELLEVFPRAPTTVHQQIRVNKQQDSLV